MACIEGDGSTTCSGEIGGCRASHVAVHDDIGATDGVVEVDPAARADFHDDRIGHRLAADPGEVGVLRTAIVMPMVA